MSIIADRMRIRIDGMTPGPWKIYPDHGEHDMSHMIRTPCEKHSVSCLTGVARKENAKGTIHLRNTSDAVIALIEAAENCKQQINYRKDGSISHILPPNPDEVSALDTALIVLHLAIEEE